MTEAFHPTSKHSQANRILTGKETHLLTERKRLWINSTKTKSELKHYGSDGKLLQYLTGSMQRFHHTATDTYTRLVLSGRDSVLFLRTQRWSLLVPYLTPQLLRHHGLNYENIQIPHDCLQQLQMSHLQKQSTVNNILSILKLSEIIKKCI